MNNKVTSIWFEKLRAKQNISVKDLYQFSKISLKKSRIRKKFEKNCEAYVSKKVYDAYIGYVINQTLLSALGKTIDFSNVEPINRLQKINLVFSDYQYNNEKND